MNKKIAIYTDGSCLGNPGPGGYGILISYHKYKETFAEGYHLTTNNRMELMAVIVSLEVLEKSYDIILHTDSQYVRNGITKWFYGWKNNDWKNAGKRPVKNVDLWKRLDSISRKHKIQWEWIRGHSGNTENEQCDTLARNAATNPTKEDIGYKKGE